MKNHDFHSCNDGRGPRRVFVNGNEMHGVIWADVSRGILRYKPLPMREHRKNKGDVYTRLLRGLITVEFVARR